MDYIQNEIYSSFRTTPIIKNYIHSVGGAKSNIHKIHLMQQPLMEETQSHLSLLMLKILSRVKNSSVV